MLHFNVSSVLLPKLGNKQYLLYIPEITKTQWKGSHNFIQSERGFQNTLSNVARNNNRLKLETACGHLCDCKLTKMVSLLGALHC